MASRHQMYRRRNATAFACAGSPHAEGEANKYIAQLSQVSKQVADASKRYMDDEQSILFESAATKIKEAISFLARIK